MSALWANLYLKTTVSVERLWEAVELLIEENPAVSIISKRVFAAAEEAKAANDTHLYRTVLVYPHFNDLYSIDIRGFFAPVDTSDRNPAWGSVYIGDGSPWPMWEKIATELSEHLKADAALLTYQRNPSIEDTIILFYKHGKAVGDYYHIQGQFNYLIQPKDAAVIETLFDGRFAFVNDLPIYADDPENPRRPFITPANIKQAREFFFHFQASELYRGWRAYHLDWQIYQPEVHRLFLPMHEPDLLPYGMIMLEVPDEIS
jgi:hypothetical protein